MTNDWIIDVLTDLRKFSASNSLGRLAERLDDTIQAATHELTATDMLAQAGMSEREQGRRYAEGACSGKDA